MKQTYPVVWLSYKQRIWLDVEAAFGTAEGKSLFDEKYQTNLSEAVRELERWQIALMSIQVALFSFLVLSLFAKKSTVSILGVSIENGPGVKELVTVLVSTVSFLALVVTASKDMRLFVLEKLVRLKTTPDLGDFALISSRSSFNSQAYFAKAFNRFIFSTIVTRALTVVLGLLVVVIGVLVIGLSVTLQLYLLLLVHNEPSIGIWSKFVVWFGISVFVMGIQWLVRFHAPLPFRDMSVLKSGPHA